LTKISSVVVGYINKVVELNKNMEIEDAENQLIPMFEYLNEVLLNFNTYLDLNFNKYFAEKTNYPAFQKYTLEENRKQIEQDEAISQRQQERMRMNTQMKYRRTLTRLQTLMNIVKNQTEDEMNPMISRSGTVKNDLLNEDLFKEYEYEELPSHDVIRLIWERIVKDLHELIFQYFDINGNSINEKSKLSTKFQNFFNTTMTTVAWNMPKNMNMNLNMSKVNSIIESKMSNIVFNQKSVGIINNALELLKSFFACESKFIIF